MRRCVENSQPRFSRGFSQGVLTIFLMFLLAVGGVAWVYIGMITQEHWPIRWLELEGAFDRVSAEQLRASLVPVANGSFFTVDLAAVKSAAFKQSWVSTVTVQKAWPDTVRVQVAEYVPLAHWIDGQLISAEGRQFQVPGADEIQGLPWLSGPDTQLESVFGTWKEFNNELMPTGLEIEQIRLDPRGAWFLELNNGTQVHIGREQATSRLQTLVKSWPGLMQGQDLAPLSIDLRYTNGFAVRWPDIPARLAGAYGKEN